MTASIVAEGLRDFARYVEQLPSLALEAAFFAVNDTSRDSVAGISKEMRTQIAFPNGYLNKDRLGIKRRATRATLEASIVARDRPTSLARFAEGATIANSRKQPLVLHIKPGKKVVLNSPSSPTKAFLVKLRNNNVGLAVRLPKGQTLKNSDRAKKLSDNVYLLYGPSVDQVMQGVATDLGPEIAEMLNRNFLRQFERLSRG